jgi:hypothetical protein
MYRDAIVAIIVLAVGFFGGWSVQGWRLTAKIEKIQADHAVSQKKLADEARGAEAAYRESEARAVRSLAEAQEIRNVEVARITRSHAAVVDSLRKRPERVVITTRSEVPSAPAACAGTTGAELARGDAEFLAGYSADAAKLEAALNQCEAAYNALRK